MSTVHLAQQFSCPGAHYRPHFHRFRTPRAHGITASARAGASSHRFRIPPKPAGILFAVSRLCQMWLLPANI